MGNKADLDERRSISEDVARQYAKDKGMTYIETSAIKTSNIKEAFVGLVRPKLSATSSASTWPTNSDSLPLSWKPRAVSRKVLFGREIRRSEKIFHESSWRKKTKKNFFVICVISVLFVVTFMFGLKLVFLGQKGGKPDEVLLNLVKQSTIVMESNSNCIIIIKIHPPT